MAWAGAVHRRTAPGRFFCGHLTRAEALVPGRHPVRVAAGVVDRGVAQHLIRRAVQGAGPDLGRAPGIAPRVRAAILVLGIAWASRGEVAAGLRHGRVVRLTWSGIHRIQLGYTP